MKKVIELSCEEAKVYFLKGSSYFNSDIPSYISFEPILTEIADVLGADSFNGFKSSSPNDLSLYILLFLIIATPALRYIP